MINAKLDQVMRDSFLHLVSLHDLLRNMSLLLVTHEQVDAEGQVVQ